MPAFSVLTNVSAMNALFKLNQTQKSLDINQERINTGLKVGSAKDDAATFVVAQGMRSDVAGFKQTRENMSLGLSTLGVATDAADKIHEQLVEIKTKVLQASNQESGRDAIQLSIDEALSSISRFVDTAQFNGVNLIDGTNDGKTFDVVSALTRGSDGTIGLSKLEVLYENLSVSSSDKGLGAIKGMDVQITDAVSNVADQGPASSTYSWTTGPTSSETVTLNVIDDEGVERQLSVSGTATANTSTEVATSFNNDHADTLASLGVTIAGSANGLVVSKADDSETQIVNLTGTGSVDLGNRTDAAKLVFNDNADDKAYGMGDEFAISYMAGGTQKTVVVRVSDSSTGAGLGVNDDGHSVYSVNINDVKGANANAIGTAFVDALTTGSADFDAVAGADVLSVVNAGGTVTITGGDASDNNDRIYGVTFTSKAFDEMLKKIDLAEQVLNDVTARLGAAQSALESQDTYVESLVNAVEDGIGTLVDANMAEESAKFQALQVQQQLGLQALSIANSNPQAILSLFQG